MYPSVVQVVAQQDYQLEVQFNNGENAILDMRPYLDFGVFSRLKVEQAFMQVYVSFDTIEWRCGVDLDPAFVYAKAIKHA